MTTRILVVDDEPAIGKLLIYQLAEFGYQVSYIQNGLLALQRMLAERPDLVLLDVMMPLISGWEVCRQIRTCSTVPVIMLTAKSADVDIVTGLSVGADDYLTKPFSMAQLHARIEAVLRRSAPAHNPGSLAARSDANSADAVAPYIELPLMAELSEPAPDAHARQPVRTGPQVRAARLARGYTLHQAERECNVRWEFLQAIEQENWDYIPRHELHQTISTYGEYLHLETSALYEQAHAYSRPRTAMRYAVIFIVVLAVVMIGLYLL
jgi:DNA-binding response OmpR family regulator